MCLIMPSIPSPSPPSIVCPAHCCSQLSPAGGGAGGRCVPPTERAQSQVGSIHITCSQTDIGGGGDDWAGYRADGEEGDGRG